MKKIIQEQLNNCRIANIPPFNLDDCHLIIEGARKPVELVVGIPYEITIENYIVNPPPNFTLADNWNNGTSPSSTLLRVQAIQELGQMVKVSGTCLPNNQFWEGWLPKKSIVKITQL